MKIKQIMTRKVVSAKVNTPVKEVLDLMVNNQVSGLPVVDEQGFLLGFIPERNLLRRSRLTAEPAARHLDPKTFVERQKKLYGQTAGDLMNTETGNVASLEEINRIEELVLAAPGVKQVLNNLLVDPMLR